MRTTVSLLAVAVALALAPATARADCWVCIYTPDATCYGVGYSETGQKACRVWHSGPPEYYWYCETYGGPCVIPEGRKTTDPTTNVTYDLTFLSCDGQLARVFAPSGVPTELRSFDLVFEQPAIRLPAYGHLTTGPGESRDSAPWLGSDFK